MSECNNAGDTRRTPQWQYSTSLLQNRTTVTFTAGYALLVMLMFLRRCPWWQVYSGVNARYGALYNQLAFAWFFRPVAVLLVSEPELLLFLVEVEFIVDALILVEILFLHTAHRTVHKSF